MQNVTRTNKQVGHRNIHCILIMAVVLTFVWGSVTHAQGIVVNETGLHDYEEVYGIDASSAVDPVTNSLPVSLSAAGESNASLYTNVSFYGYGIYAEPNGTNSGDVTVQGFGGNADGMGGIYSFATLYGIYVKGDGDNSGAITVDVLAGETDAISATTARASSYIDTYGIYSWSTIENSGDVNVVATGRLADASARRRVR